MATASEHKRERDRLLLRVMARRGIADPRTTLRVTRKVNRKFGHMPLSRACAMLEKESGGGRNVFGHDQGGAVIGGVVTKQTYQAYLSRVRRGAGDGGGIRRSAAWKAARHFASCFCRSVA